MGKKAAGVVGMLLLSCYLMPLAYAEILRSFSGSGSFVTDMLWLTKGVYVFDITISKPNTYSSYIQLKSNDGDFSDYLAILSTGSTYLTTSSTVRTADFYLLDIDLGIMNEGTWEITIRRPDALPGAYIRSLPLIEGWNLVSLPIQPLNAAPDQVLAPIINNVVVMWAYDGTWAFFVPGFTGNNLNQLVPYRGYWIKVTEPCTLVIEGTLP